LNSTTLFRIVSSSAVILHHMALPTDVGAQEALAVIPQPAAVTVGSGFFQLGNSTRVLIQDTSSQEMVTLARHTVSAIFEWTGRTLMINEGQPRDNTIALRLIEGATDSTEKYRLDITRQGVTISASSGAGVFYGIQTLRHLLASHTPRDGRPETSGSASPSEPVALPVAVIEDQPRFPYRGMHLDVGRHMYPVEFIKRYIDLIALYKMNTFHWHLTEDQGWRIEILKYPLLTQVGAYRSETMVEQNFDPYVGDGIRYGGYYTQDQIRDVVAYAADRYVTIIPEIEMPGHSTAAIAAYPELGCTNTQVAVASVWGVHENVFCPKEETFQFLEDVLSEVISLFPGPYIHIGGDEAPKTQWEASPIARSVIEREGLTDEHELQSYFIKRIETFLLSRNRRLIGWDEILEGGLAPEATVMSWRGVEGGIEAARQGHDVIMTPTSHVYFDYYQADPETEPLAIGGFLPLSKVYEFDPVPSELTEQEARHILGAQGNVWTEYLKTPEQVEYMAFPRMLALSEVVWSPAGSRNWENFVQRLSRGLQLLDRIGVNYRPLEGR